jgi:dTDP-4-amino-4,6-dideoxygalactose transaminase
VVERTRAGGRVKAVIPVHLYGAPADMPSILGVAEEFALTVIEDCAQAHGAMLAGRRVGTWGHAAAFSFYPTKNLGAFGDGGAVVTSDPVLAEKVRSLREYGWKKRYDSEIPGMNSRLDELQAAILRAKLPFLDIENEQRRRIAKIYQTLQGTAGLAFQRGLQESNPVYHQFVVSTPQRESLRAWLDLSGIKTLVHYPVPVHRQRAFQGSAICVGSLANTEHAASSVLSLPIYPELPEEAAERVVSAIQGWEGK